MQNLKVSDEGHYWETGDEKLLEDTFNEYTELIEKFGSSIEIFPMNEVERYEAYFERLMIQIHRKKKDKYYFVRFENQVVLVFYIFIFSLTI